MQDDLFSQLCSYENLEKAFMKARKRKTLKPYVIEFEKNLEENLKRLRSELIFHIYKPQPLETFIMRDPKTRKISKSDFRDRVIHHALINIIEPIFDKDFIYDNFANRIGKGTFNAINRFDSFKRKISKNNSRKCFTLKADIKHYFQTIDHEILLNIIKRKIKDPRLVWLIKKILSNHERERERERRGMPLGNLTSQFFANVYLNELDQFVKHKLKTKYYIRYVDDFIVLHHSRKILEEYKIKINEFLKTKLKLELHPDKSNILQLDRGIGFLGFRIFFYHKLIKKKNLNHFERKFKKLRRECKDGKITKEKVIEKFEGWLAYVSHANAFKYKKNLIKIFNHHFQSTFDKNITNKKKYENYINKVKLTKIKFSIHKTFYLFKKGLNVNEIAKIRGLKEGTIWEHIAKLIQYKQLSVFDILPKSKIFKILSKIKTKNDILKEIKQRLGSNLITYDEINCVLAMVKSQTKTSPKRL